MGIDQLPRFIRESSILTGNDLGKLGSLEELPTPESAQQYLKDLESGIHESDYHRIYREGLEFLASDPIQAGHKIELAAKAALAAGNSGFAINALVLHNDQ